jgi:hypothetical protein
MRVIERDSGRVGPSSAEGQGIPGGAGRERRGADLRASLERRKGRRSAGTNRRRSRLPFFLRNLELSVDLRPERCILIKVGAARCIARIMRVPLHFARFRVY